MDARSAPAPGPRGGAEARQRWRIVFRRGTEADRLAQRDVAAAWEAALVASGLPLPSPGRRPRLAFGAPLPVGMTAERELADLSLAELRPLHEVRAALVAALPAGFELVDLHDVWVGEPPLAGKVAAADYRITLESGEPGSAASEAAPAADVGGEAVELRAAELRAAAEALLASRELPRDRQKGSAVVRYDLRPLLVDLDVDPGPPPVIRARTRLDPVLGTGRPEEVVAAIGERLGRKLRVAAIVRERVLLADELGRPVRDDDGEALPPPTG